MCHVDILVFRMHLMIISLMRDLLAHIHFVISVCKDLLDLNFRSLLYLLLTSYLEAWLLFLIPPVRARPRHFYHLGGKGLLKNIRFLYCHRDNCLLLELWRRRSVPNYLSRGSGLITCLQRSINNVSIWLEAYGFF